MSQVPDQAVKVPRKMADAREQPAFTVASCGAFLGRPAIAKIAHSSSKERKREATMQLLTYVEKRVNFP
jgi:hypothetical protein